MRMCSVENVTATVPSLSHTVPVWQMHGRCMAHAWRALSQPLWPSFLVTCCLMKGSPSSPEKLYGI